jgi:hypothetical protein
MCADVFQYFPIQFLHPCNRLELHDDHNIFCSILHPRSPPMAKDQKESNFCRASQYKYDNTHVQYDCCQWNRLKNGFNS